MPWANIARDLARDFGWGPEQVGRLTMYQALVYLGAECHESLDGKDSAQRNSTPEEVRAFFGLG